MKNITGNVSSRQSSSAVREVGTASLPCLYKNNANRKAKEELRKKKNCSGKEEVIQAGLMSSAQKKSAEVLRLNVARFITISCVLHVGFLTLTFVDNVREPKEAYRRFNSFNTGFIKRHSSFSEWICVKERQKRGAWHFHLVIDCGGDIRTGFDRSEVKQRRYSACTPLLRQLWSDLRVALPKYGFGRHQLEPILSDAESMAKYLGKYISKHIGCRLPEDKGVRLVSYSSKWIRSSSNFQWNTENSALWRHGVRFFALCHGFADMDTIGFFCGPRWGYRLLGYILGTDWETLSKKDDVTFLEYRRLLQMYLGLEMEDYQDVYKLLAKIGLEFKSSLLADYLDTESKEDLTKCVRSAFQYESDF